MQLTLAAHLLCFYGVANATPIATPNVPTNPTTTVNPFVKGYQGPGVYTLTILSRGLRADLYRGGSKPNTPIYGWASSGPGYNANQYWQIADVGQGQVIIIIIQNGTGTLFSAGSGASDGQATNCTGQSYPPWRKEARWIVEPHGSTAAVFRSVAYPSNVMDVLNPNLPSCGFDTPVQAALKDSSALSQQWELQVHL
ncbi:MAG: hypothetical protein Q9210_003987 [Variospora velana]